MFNLFIIILLLISTIFISSTTCGKIPEYIQLCHRNDPKVSACIKKSVENLKPNLIKGIPELDIPALDPFTIEEVVVFDGSEIPNVKAKIREFLIKGLRDFQVNKLKINFDKNTYRIGVSIPFVETTGIYDVDANILGRKIKTSGNFLANATGIDGQAVLQAAVEENKLKFTSMALKLKVNDFNFDLPNLLSEDPALGQTAKQILSTMSKDSLMKLALPYIEKKCSSVLLKMANKIVKNFNYDEIFPE